MLRMLQFCQGRWTWWEEVEEEKQQQQEQEEEQKQVAEEPWFCRPSSRQQTL
jgi:hypothetical protein